MRGWVGGYLVKKDTDGGAAAPRSRGPACPGPGSWHASRARDRVVFPRFTRPFPPAIAKRPLSGEVTD